MIWLDTTGNFDSFQTFFRPDDSSVLQLVHIIHEFVSFIDEVVEKRYSRSGFFILSKAFVRV